MKVLFALFGSTFLCGSLAFGTQVSTNIVSVHWPLPAFSMGGFMPMTWSEPANLVVLGVAFAFAAGQIQRR